MIQARCAKGQLHGNTCYRKQRAFCSCRVLEHPSLRPRVVKLNRSGRNCCSGSHIGSNCRATVNSVCLQINELHIVQARVVRHVAARAVTYTIRLYREVAWKLPEPAVQGVMIASVRSYLTILTFVVLGCTYCFNGRNCNLIKRDAYIL